MMMGKTTFLGQPGVVSTLGNDMSSTMAMLLNPKGNLLTLSDQWIEDKKLYFGAVNQQLYDFDDDTPSFYRNRNNQLLNYATKQIETQIYQAIELYGCDNIGVVIGTSTTGIDENIPAFKSFIQGNSWSETNLNLKHSEMSSPADFIAWRYQLKSFSYGISTACTSGARALISAARLLKSGLCSAVICGGVDTLSMLTIHGFNSLEVLSSKISNPFSKNRDGINIGEAAAVFLMTMDENTGLPILSYAASSDAWHMSSPRPDALGAKLCISKALNLANTTPKDISWINLHGTGTQLNDAMESRAIAEIFGDTIPCTSTKPYTGHTLGAAGALEVALLWGVISQEFNPLGKIPLHQWDGMIDDQLPKIKLSTLHDRLDKITSRVALSSSFAFGGNNAVIMLGE